MLRAGFVATFRRRRAGRPRAEPHLGDARASERRPPSPPSPAPRAPRRRRRWPWALARWTLILGIWATLALGAVVGWYWLHLPDVGGIASFDRRPSITFLASDASVLATTGDLYAGPVELAELPPSLVLAVLATEDRRFYRHFGLDVMGLARAAIANLRAGRVVQGGSTITQQLAKNVFLTPERSLGRKIQETLLAFWLERRFSKDQILTIYLNRVYLGAGTWGVEAAARRYFGKSARALNPHEAAVIAGLLKAPSRYAPTASVERAKARAADVIDNMVEAGFWKPAEAEAAKRLALGGAAAQPVGRSVRWFTDWLADQVSGFVGYVDRDLVVVTTLDSRLQRLAEATVAETMAKEAEKAKADQAALVTLAPDGAIRAMIGGRDYAESQFNRATAALRQPGSAFKAFVYLAAVEQGLRADDRVSDASVSIGDWTPRNFEGDAGRGEIPARDAFARSVNTAAVRIAQRVGLDRVIATARRLGIVSPLRRDYATTLGASETTVLELAGAYTPFANGGLAAEPWAIVEIRDAAGKPVWKRRVSGATRLIDRRALATMHELMGAVVQQGTGRAAALDRPVAGKTGTSNDYRDGWFVGFTADYVTAVWVGNDDATPTARVTGGGLPARLWKAYMIEAERGLPVRAIPGGASQGGLDELIESIFGRGAPETTAAAGSGPARPVPVAPPVGGASRAPHANPRFPDLNRGN